MSDVAIDIDAELANAAEDTAIEPHVRAVVASLVRARREIVNERADLEVVRAIHEHRRFGRRNIQIISAVSFAMHARTANYRRPSEERRTETEETGAKP